MEMTVHCFILHWLKNDELVLYFGFQCINYKPLSLSGCVMCGLANLSINYALKTPFC